MVYSGLMDVEQLPKTLWMASTRSVNKYHTKLIAHGVRGAHTLCGIEVSTETWTYGKDLDGVSQCQTCLAMRPDCVTSPEVLVDSGVTYRQLDYWCTKGYLRAGNPGAGRRRMFPVEEVKVARRMGLLVSAGVSLETAHRVARTGGPLTPGVTVVFDGEK